VTGGFIKKFQPVNSPKITDLIIEQIREAILTGTVKPSEQLPPERELVKRFKASRIAIASSIPGSVSMITRRGVWAAALSSRQKIANGIRPFFTVNGFTSESSF